MRPKKHEATGWAISKARSILIETRKIILFVSVLAEFPHSVDLFRPFVRRYRAEVPRWSTRKRFATVARARRKCKATMPTGYFFSRYRTSLGGASLTRQWSTTLPFPLQISVM